ncbi:MAG: carbon-nitrogen hydrolase family protein [Planctomycetaceae bacterium]
MAFAPPARPDAPRPLTVGVVQFSVEPRLAENRDKVAGFIRQAKARGCRVVVFPRTALYWPPDTLKSQVDEAVASLQKVVDDADVYALIVGLYKRHEGEKPFERLLVIDPDGRIIHTYNQLWYDLRFKEAPGLFKIDGIPCAAAICADRWIRSVEELPAVAGAKVLFECSNNYDNEWIPDLGWYWYVPRALRNGVFVVYANTSQARGISDRPGHGHSALIAPDGNVVAAAGTEIDKLLIGKLDLAQATGSEARKRLNHPLFRTFWETGIAALAGRRADPPLYEPLVSPTIELTIAAAQMACSRSIEENVATITGLIKSAAAQRADVVVLPELAVTGARDADIVTATPADVARALAALQQAAKDAAIHVACGLPWQSGGKRYNCAVVIDPRGEVLTRYAQVVVDRPELFAPGMSTADMWFEIRGVPCVVTVGHDALWSEMAELAAVRGAQVHLHLAYDQNATSSGELRRKQLWVNLASFRTFTATVNAASPEGLENPSAPASGGSALWEDYYRASGKWAGGYAPHSAVRLTEARQGQAILYATQMVHSTNSQFQRIIESSNPQMFPWYVMGAKAICSTSPIVSANAGSAER